MMGARCTSEWAVEIVGFGMKVLMVWLDVGTSIKLMRLGKRSMFSVRCLRLSSLKMFLANKQFKLK